MKTTIKPVAMTTAVILILAGTFVAGLESRPFFEAHFAGKPQETAKVNYAPKEYGMNELVENAINTKFIELPKDLETLNQQRKGN